MEYKEFRNRLRQILEQKGISMKETSYSIDKPKGYVSAVIRDEQNMNVRDLLNLCDSIGVVPADLFSENVENPVLMGEFIIEAKSHNSEQLRIMMDLMRNMK